MDCKEFEEHIDDYFSDPDFDWRLREEMDDHYFSCEKCYETYQIAKFMADENLKTASLRELVKLQKEEAGSFIKERNPEEAIKCYEDILEIEPDNAFAKSMLASLLRETGVPKSEIPKEYIDELVLGLIVMAESFLENENNTIEDYQKALDFYKQAYLLVPDDVYVVIKLAILFNKTNELDLGRRVLDEYFETTPLTADIYFRKMLRNAGDSFLSKKYDEAKKDLEELISLDPKNRNALNIIANIYNAQDDYGKAIEYYSLAYDIDKNALSLSQMGYCEFRLGNINKAKEYIEQAYSEEPDVPTVINNYAIIKSEAGELEEALRIFKKLELMYESEEGIGRHSATIYNNIAIAYFYMSRKQEALRYMKLALDLEPENIGYIHNYDVLVGASEGVLLYMM